MNQYLKGEIYELGTDEHAQFIASVAGLSDLEKKILFAWHRGEDDLSVMNDNGLSKKSYEPIERKIRKKIAIAVFDCINFKMQFIAKM